MSIETTLYSTLAADSTVSAIVGTKIYPNPAPQGTAKPMISYFVVSGTREHTLTGVGDMQRKLIQVNCHADTYSGAKTLANAVIGALEGDGYMTNYIDLYDPQVQTHTVAIDWSFLL